MYIEWSKKLETGIEKIDEQHKILVDIINKLYENVIVKKNGAAVNEILMELKIYTINHFRYEEKLLQKQGFPEAEEHKGEHDEFKNTISGYLYDISSTRLEQGYNIVDFLKTWLMSHILINDMKYVEYFKKETSFFK